MRCSKRSAGYCEFLSAEQIRRARLHDHGALNWRRMCSFVFDHDADKNRGDAPNI